jgi:hypothetical protein
MLVDVDDIFVGERGTRLKQEDVQVSILLNLVLEINAIFSIELITVTYLIIAIF